MLQWLAIFGVFLVAGAGCIYSLRRLKPTIQAVQAELRQIKLISAAFSSKTPTDDGWRNDERRLTSMLNDLQFEQKDIKSDTAALLEEQSKKIESLSKNGDNFEKTISKQILQLERLTTQLQNTPLASERMAAGHTRVFSTQTSEKMLKELIPELGIEITARQLHHLAHKISSTEAISHGRIATSIETIVTRCLVAVSLIEEDTQSFSCLEIGVLFGIGTVCLYDAVRFRVPEVKFYLMDPLDGYYGRHESDYVSFNPVTLPVLTENMRIAGVKDDEFTIIQAMSESEEAISQMSDKTLDLLVIDGDHSYDGVKRDFENYLGNVRKGGFIIIDDYGVKEWPDIKKYADKEVIPRDDVETVYKGARTLLLRHV